MDEHTTVDISHDIGEKFVLQLTNTMKHYYATYGEDVTNKCFPNALAVATGNMLSAWCLTCGADRRVVFTAFEKLYREFAKQHKEWKVSQSH